MRTVMRFRRILETPKYCSITKIRNFAEYGVLNVCELEVPKKLVGFPRVEALWAKYVCIKTAENNFKRFLLNQFLSECHINKSDQVFEKFLVMHSSIGILMKHNLVSSVNDLIDGLLAPLEPYPYDSSELFKKEQTEWDLTAMDIRNSVERQYLAWKYKIDLQNIKEISHRYRFCFYEYRSMENLRANIDAIEKLPGISNLCLAEKIYLINQKPFNINSVRLFQDTITGLNWQLFPQYCPKLLLNSHQYILFVISVLREMDFSEKQIQYGIPFLYLTFPHFLYRLKNMLLNPQIAKFRDEDKFLQLLSFPKEVLVDLINLRRASFLELTEIISVSSKNLTPSLRLVSAKSIMYYITQFYSVNYNCVEILRKHPKYKLSSEEQILDTLKFLKSKDFTIQEIADSVTIVLYPRNGIEKALAKIDSESKTLQKYGFRGGCLRTGTNFFEKGTKDKRKVLQLCLYYLEKPHHFSGDGIWDSEGTDNETDSAHILSLS